MKRNNLVVVILFSVLALSLLVYFYLTTEEEVHYNWQESYNAASDQPYGTLFIKKLLEDYRPGQHFTFNDKTPLSKLLDYDAIADSADYVFVGQELNVTEADKDALLEFVHSGNDAFIASINMPFDVVDPVFPDECGRDIFLEKYEWKTVSMNFFHKSLQTEKGYFYTYRNGPDEQKYFWNTLNPQIFCDSVKSVTPLGSLDSEHVNFIKLPYGNGNFYIHSNPIAFTNYFISTKDKAEYAAGVFSHLGGKSIIWDEFSKSPFVGKNAPYSSPLSYILQHKSLKYAWWMMLGTVLIYTFLAAKRKQRVIPVLEPKVNTSLEYVKMISALHFQNGNHLDIARKKMKYFLYFIRAKYGIHIQHYNEAHGKRLSEKSKVDIKDIERVFNEFEQIERNQHYNTSEHKMVSLYNAIDNFYKHCK